jgi:hypothetical protein
LVTASGVAAAASVLFVVEDATGFQPLVPVLRETFPGASEVTRIALGGRRVILFSLVESGSGATAAESTSGKKSKVLVSSIPSGGADLAALCEQADVVVAAGPVALESPLVNCPTPRLSLLLSRYRTEQAQATAKAGPKTAIYLEADPILNLRLVRRALPKAAKIAVLVSPRTESWLPRLQSEAAALGFELQTIQANDDEEAVRGLRERLKEINALLLIPDESLINRWSLKPILLMTARHFVPVFGGLVEGYVKVGVTAAVVQDITGSGPQIQRFVRQLARGETPAPAYPESTRTAVNPVVARNLSIPIANLEGADGP